MIHPIRPRPTGQAKATAEAILRSSLANVAIARTCLVYGTDWRDDPPALDKRLPTPSSASAPGSRWKPTSRSIARRPPGPTWPPRSCGSCGRRARHLPPGRAAAPEPGRLARETARAFGLDAGLVQDQPLPDKPLFGNDVGLAIAQTQARLGWSPITPQEGLARLAASFAYADA